MTWLVIALIIAVPTLAWWWLGARNQCATSPRERTLEELLAEEERRAKARVATPTVILNDRSSLVDEARQTLQKTAYEMVGNRHSDAEKQRFKQGMTKFAAVDPLVKRIAERAQGIVSRHPGIMQSKIYVHFPEYDKEKVRYALYFAHELGLIYRKKKGSSYQLFPPGTTIEMISAQRGRHDLKA